MVIETLNGNSIPDAGSRNRQPGAAETRLPKGTSPALTGDAVLDGPKEEKKTKDDRTRKKGQNKATGTVRPNSPQVDRASDPGGGNEARSPTTCPPAPRPGRAKLTVLAKGLGVTAPGKKKRRVTASRPTARPRMYLYIAEPDERIDDRMRDDICRKLGLRLMVTQRPADALPDEIIAALGACRQQVGKGNALPAARMLVGLQLALPLGQPGVLRDMVMDKTRVSAAALSDAVLVVTRGIPELERAVEVGTLAVSDAARLAALDTQDVLGALDGDEEEVSERVQALVQQKARAVREVAAKTDGREPDGAGRRDETGVAAGAPPTGSDRPCPDRRDGSDVAHVPAGMNGTVRPQTVEKSRGVAMSLLEMLGHETAGEVAQVLTAAIKQQQKQK